MKNLVVYELPKDYTLNLVGRDFETFKFQSCKPFQQESKGFVETALGSYVETLSGGVQLLTVRTQKKVPEKAHVDHLTQEKVGKLKSVGQSVTKDELQRLKEESFAEVLAVTFPKPPEDHLIFIKGNMVYVEEGSYKKAENHLQLLEALVGEVIPCSPQEEDPTIINLLNEEPPEPWTIGNSAKLIDIDERVVSISKGDICCDITKDLVEAGAELDFIELEYDSTLIVKVKPSLEFKSLKFCKDFMNEVIGDAAGSTLLQVNETIKMFESLKGITSE
jgi:DNA recombination-dependent growth factor C